MVATALPVVVTLGDSITEYGAKADESGWVWMLCQDYRNRAAVVNWGKSGWTTRRWLPEIAASRDELAALSPSLITVLLGTNDAAPAFYRSGVPLEEYTTTMRGILGVVAQACPSAQILLIAPPAVVDEVFGLPQNERVYAYADVCRQLGSELRIPVVDLWTATQDHPEYFCDGIHLSSDGNRELYRLVLDAIRCNMAHLLPDRIGAASSWWKRYFQACF
ncbi:hypothetical protein H310_10448 [Aphanomyces invadans]|uniref:SGNH hydrolase-type esterase domain-containing protein n=1 Tax=Aphanomyces invadans TaxID=157072 RepID=A0A024TQ59_9STRA|nr:hypothetical protein H310_10448 [Aphanomyces invadans]ETV96275.1 hypothetical protein H310_10448 [Aphanomyces invadans]|eukprot:XP_008875067.1 hypothetical protein H310_10448 [Aphanomyces invadans]